MKSWILLTAVFLVACGGGGSSPPAAVTPPPVVPPVVTPPVVPPLATSLSASSGSAQVADGEVGALAFTVTVTGSSSTPIVPVLTYDATVLALQGAIDTSTPGRYVVNLATAANLPVGTYVGQVLFRLCQDVSCAAEYPSTQQSFNYSVVSQLGDWGTFQRNAAHTGFVNVTLDASKFRKVWTWSRPAGDPEPIGGINSIATGAGHVYVTKDVYFGQAQIFALDEGSGAVAWTYAFGEMASEGPPAFAKGNVYVTTTDPNENCVTWAVDATTGLYKFKMPYGCQWSAFFAPTVAGGAVLTTSQAGTVDTYSAVDGSTRWSASASAGDQSTPAGDSRYVYQYGGSYFSTPSLKVFDAASGATVASIDDPFSSGLGGYSLFSAPMLGANGNAIVFSAGGFSGMAASSSEQYAARVLVNYDIAAKATSWRSANSYLVHPAIANGVVYSARNAPATLDALSETDGRILWSWTPPAADSSFHRNIVVARNLLFVSTDANVYAIDLTTHLPVWKYPRPGMLAVSAGMVLYIATVTSDGRLSDGGLVAIKLN